MPTIDPKHVAKNNGQCVENNRYTFWELYREYFGNLRITLWARKSSIIYTQSFDGSVNHALVPKMLA